MIDTNKARDGLLSDNSLIYREYDGSISYTIWRSIDTPDTYYWYTIHDVPIKSHHKVELLYESKVFYGFEELLADFNKEEDD